MQSDRGQLTIRPAMVALLRGLGIAAALLASLVVGAADASAAACGNGKCQAGESCSSCPSDCGVCAPVCGDGTCESSENCSVCAADCGACPPVCGDGTCEPAESCGSCAADCGACSSCGDGSCDVGENCSSCSADCGVCVTCGDGTCGAGESCSTCSADCGTCTCGNGTCEATENCGSCVADCGSCSSCGDGVCDGSEDCSTCTGDCGACTDSDTYSCPPDMPACSADRQNCCYRDFGVGSIIIPMDRCHQTTEGSGKRSVPTRPNAFCANPTGGGDDGLYQAYGMIYRLMQNDIDVYWLINPTKDPPALTDSQNLNSQSYNDRDIDFWVLSSGAQATRLNSGLSGCGPGCTPPVLHLDDNLNAISGSYTKKQFPTRGGSFIIAAEDRNRFYEFFTRSGEFSGYAGDNFYDFRAVEMFEIQPGAEIVYLDYRGNAAPYAEFNAGTSGPVAVTLNYEPPRLARESPASVSSQWLAKAKLNQPANSATCKTGAFEPETAVYCDLTTADMAAGVLTSGRFDWAWLDLWNASGNSCASAEARALMDELHIFMTAQPGVKNGNSVFMMGSPLDIAEQCAGQEPLGAPGGLDLANQTPRGPFIIRYPANVFSQFGDMPLGFASGATGKWGYSSNGYQNLSTLTRLVSEDNTGNGACSNHVSTGSCDVFSQTNGDSDDAAAYARFQDVPANGVIFYMGGRNISQNPNSAHLRMVLNSFLALPAGFVNSEPDTETTTEVSRSQPIVASVDGIEALYQGTIAIISPARTLTTYTGAASDATFEFPYFKGHMRAIDVANVGTTETDFDSVPAVLDAADGIPAANPAGCSEYFTSGCRTVFTSTRGGDNTTPPTQVELDAGTFGSRPNRLFLTTGAVLSGPDDDLDGVSDLHQLLGSSFTQAEAQTLLSRILAGRDDDGDGIYEPELGGVDRSTVAIIEESPFAGVARPTMVYFGALDGMVHAVCASVLAPCQYKGQELWAYMPRSQLPLIASNQQRIDGSMTVSEVFGRFDGVRYTYKTVLTFQTGTGNSVVSGAQPAALALDITDPSDPQVLWEISTPATREQFEIGTGLDTAMGPVKVGNELKQATFIQSKNGGLGGAGFVIEAVDTVTGENLWSFDHAYPEPASADPNLRDPTHPGAPTRGYPNGVAALDLSTAGYVTHLVAPSLYGEVYLIDADSGLNENGVDPLFRFTEDYHPIGATPAIFRSRSSGKLLAVAVSGGYADPVETAWSPDTVFQYAVGIPIESENVPITELTATAEGGFVINLGLGERAFGSAVIAGNELFIVTDSGDVNNLGTFGQGGASGTLSRYSLSNTSSPILIDSTLAGGAGSANVRGGVIYTGSGKSAKKIDISADFDAEGADVSVGALTDSRRMLWLRLR